MTTELTYAIPALGSDVIKALASLPLDRLREDELIDVIVASARLQSVAHDTQLRLIGRLHRTAPPVALGGEPLATMLSTRYRISEAEARRMIAEAVELGY